MNTDFEAQIAEYSIADHLMHILRESSAARRGSAALALSGHLEDKQALILAGPAPTSPTLRALSLALGDRHGLREIAAETAAETAEEITPTAGRNAQQIAQHEDHRKIRHWTRLRAPDGSELTIASADLQPDTGDADRDDADTGDADTVGGRVGSNQNNQQDDDQTLVERVWVATAPASTAPASTVPASTVLASNEPAAIAPAAPTPDAPATKPPASKKLTREPLVSEELANERLASKELDGGAWKEALDEGRLLTAVLRRLTLADLLDGILDVLVSIPAHSPIGSQTDSESGADDAKRRKKAAAREVLATWRIDPARSAFVLLARQDIVTRDGRLSASSAITVRDLRLLRVRQDTNPRRDDQGDDRGRGPGDRPYGDPHHISGPASIHSNTPAKTPDSLSTSLSAVSTGVSTDADRVDAIVGLAPGSITSAIEKLLEGAWRKIVREEPWTRLPAWLSDKTALDEHTAPSGPDPAQDLVLNDTIHRSAAGRRGRPFIGASQWLDDEAAKLAGNPDASAMPAPRRDKHLRAVLAAAREIAAASMLCGGRG